MMNKLGIVLAFILCVGLLVKVNILKWWMLLCCVQGQYHWNTAMVNKLGIIVCALCRDSAVVNRLGIVVLCCVCCV